MKNHRKSCHDTHLQHYVAQKFQHSLGTLFANNKSVLGCNRIHNRGHHLHILRHVCRTLHSVNVLWVFVSKWTLVPSSVGCVVGHGKLNEGLKLRQCQRLDINELNLKINNAKF